MSEDPQPDEPPETPPAWTRVHLWEIAWVRDVAVVAGLLAAVFLLGYFRLATIPIVTAFVLSRVVAPGLDAVEDRLGWPRAVTAAVVVLAATGGSVVLAVAVLPEIAADVKRLVEQAPEYVERLRAGVLEVSGGRFERLQDVNLPGAKEMLGGAVVIAQRAASAVGTLTELILGGILTFVWFAYFTFVPHATKGLLRLISPIRRGRVRKWLVRFEEVFVGYVRGQLLVAAFTFTGFAIGLSAVGVPHALVAATVGGALSIIPNGQASGWLLGVALMALGADAPLWQVVLLPSSVYAVTQSLETFVITPFVQGSYVRLHPLAVLTAVVAGGSALGLIGMFLAIPLTACARIVLEDLWARQGSQEA